VAAAVEIMQDLTMQVFVLAGLAVPAVVALLFREQLRREARQRHRQLKVTLAVQGLADLQ
jgi:hypothetical protein